LEQKPEKMKLGKFISKVLLPIMMQLLPEKLLEPGMFKKKPEEKKKTEFSMKSSESSNNKLEF